MKKERKNVKLEIIISMLLTAFIVLIIFIKEGYLCFGDNSLACMDAYMQYIDFFSYLKDIILGKNSLFYSFSKGLGGSGIALFAYYLASPLNLLVVFVPKEHMPLFLDVLFIIKTSLAAATFSYYLNKRFNRSIDSVITVVLAVGYGLMQYNVSQASNIMWLDGSYMLPLMILGVYYLVKQNKIVFLSITTGMTILFNWYVGGINCLFVILWFVFELSINIQSKTKNKLFIQYCINKLFLFICSMSIGVGISAMLFLPSAIALRGGKGASFNFKNLRLEFVGNVISIFQNHTVGARSSLGSAALFAGSLVVIGIIAFFFSKVFSVREKIIAGVFVAISVGTLYFQTLYFTFSLFQEVGSYIYRFSYVVIFAFCFIAAWYFSRYKLEENNGAIFVKYSIVFSGLLLFLSYVHPIWDDRNVYDTVICMILISIFLAMRKNVRGKAHGVATGLLFLTAIFEIGMNVDLLMNSYHSSTISTQYYNYANEMQAFSDDLKEADNSFYRVGQTVYRDSTKDNLRISPCLNDGLAYGINTNISYSSCSENVQLQLMEQLGYKTWGYTLNVVNTSIIPADSLLGVKYIASDYPILGLEPVSEIRDYANKKIYRNPYALPLIYSSSGTNREIVYEKNPFLFINEIYKIVADDNDLDIFNEISYTQKDVKYGKSYVLDISEITGPIYGNILMDMPENTKIYIDGEYCLEYAKWLSSSVFYIPIKENAKTVTVMVKSDAVPNIEQCQFYVMNEKRMEKVSNEIMSSNTVTNLQVSSDHITCKAISTGKTFLRTSILADDGWKIKVNGKRVVPYKLANSLFSIPLENGENDIELKYSTPGLGLGFLVTIISLLALIFISLNMQKIQKMAIKYSEILRYIIVGGLTTIVSLGTYYGCVITFLNPQSAWQLQFANVISWTAAVTFSYIASRVYVFNSIEKKWYYEAVAFYASRLTTLFLDMGIMFLMVTLMQVNDKAAKLIVQIVVMVLNYVLSKLFVFKKK